MLLQQHEIPSAPRSMPLPRRQISGMLSASPAPPVNLQKSTSTLGTGKHALLYLQLHEERHTGRGFPNGKMLDEGICITQRMKLVFPVLHIGF